MGQMTFALMFGAKLPDAPDGKSWWDEYEGEEYQPGILESFKPGRGGKQPDTDSGIVGYFVAVGASGMRGIPHLKGPISLTAAENDERYAKAIASAQEHWPKWAAHCAEHGIKLNEPRLWLVETEVA